jgi:hypothetical protein
MRVTSRKLRTEWRNRKGRGEREVCVDRERVCVVSQRTDGSWYFYAMDDRLPRPFNTLCAPYQGHSTWPTADDAVAACIAFVREHLTPLKPGHSHTAEMRCCEPCPAYGKPVQR